MNIPISITRFAFSMYANIASVFASTTSVVHAFEKRNIVLPASCAARAGLGGWRVAG